MWCSHKSNTYIKFAHPSPLVKAKVLWHFPCFLFLSLSRRAKKFEGMFHDYLTWSVRSFHSFIINSLTRDFWKRSDKYALTREWERLDSNVFVFFLVFVHDEEEEGRQTEIYIIDLLHRLRTSRQFKYIRYFFMKEMW